MQLELSLDAPRERGRLAAERCAQKASRVSNFDVDAAQNFVKGWLARYGQQSGEDLVDAAVEHGHRPHDSRAFGSVFRTLARKGIIECAGFCMRRKGNATAGGRVWRLKA